MMPPRVVLVRPRNADNLAAIALTMQSFALTDWVLVSSEVHLRGMLGVLAHHREPNPAAALLHTARRVDTLEQAIADCSWVVGTTMRTLPGRPRLTARQLAQCAALRSEPTWALVFGAECNGLTDDDLRQCHALSYLPTQDEQPSLNLAQAVLVYAHELAAVPRGEATSPPEALADDATLRVLRTVLVAGLYSAGLLRRKSSNQGAVDVLMGCLTRSRLTVAEAALWGSALRARTSDGLPAP